MTANDNTASAANGGTTTTATDASIPASNAATATAPAVPSGPVWDALISNPGTSVAAIAEASGGARDAVRAELAGYAEAGWATRVTGGGRAGDAWTAVPPELAPDEVPPPSDAEADAAKAEPAALDTGTDATNDESAPLAEAVPVLTPETIQNAMAIMAAEAERRATAEAELRKAAAEEEARRQKILAGLAKARTAEDTRRALSDLLVAVTATYTAVDAGDEATASAGLTRVFAATDEVRRATRSPRMASAARTSNGSGYRARSDRATPRPLRPEVIAHLVAHPDKEFTPGEIARVLDRSSGAVANALDTLVKNGVAVLAHEHPARYRAVAAGAPVTAAPPDDPSDATGPADVDATTAA